MREEFHGDGISGGKRKQLYGWNTLNPNVWLPSLSELVGYDSSHYYDPNGCWYAAMQGLNISNGYNVDNKGGTQFIYFAQSNISGGGEKLWNAVQKQTSWVRSCVCLNADRAWRTTDASNLNTSPATASFAVHPAGDELTDPDCKC